MLNVQQVLPSKIVLPLRGLYLSQRLAEMPAATDKSLVIADFLTDKNGIVATSDAAGRFRVPPQIRNTSDWGLLQELMSQADVVISGGSYFKSLASTGSSAQDILYQFEPGNEFEALGRWRLSAGYERRSPDLAIVTRDLGFALPPALSLGGRKVAIFTTDFAAESSQGKALKNANTTVVGSGEEGVDARKLISTLSNQMGYRVIMMASGPSLLELLLAARLLDLLYVTQAQVAIPVNDPATVRTIFSGGRKMVALQEFSLSHKYIQDDVVAEDGSRISQAFLRYDRKGIGQ
jgi:riboflavin biosynthesis pyrimidine reductase